MPRWPQCLTAALIASTLAAAAHAQYVWLDEKGVRQYSDMAPPAGVPRQRILKTPRQADVRSFPPTQSDAPTTTAASKAPMTTAEQNAAFQKRKAEQADQDKKEAEKTRLEKDRAHYCDQTQAYYRNLESGRPISHIDKHGERTFLTDEQRAHELADARHTLSECE